MGQRTVIELVARRLKAEDLKTHPGFSLPPRPQSRGSRAADFVATCDYALEVSARLVSPSPKEDGEDESFSCDDLAAAIRSLKGQL